MTAAIPEFGDAEPEATYVLRPGGYAVIFDGRGRLAVVLAGQCLHLPGGGQGAGESVEEAAVREVVEETGLNVALRRLIGVADELVFARSAASHYRKRCWFFEAAVIGTAEPSEADHELRWMPVDEAARGLSHESQRWAVREALRGAAGGSA